MPGPGRVDECRLKHDVNPAAHCINGFGGGFLYLVPSQPSVDLRNCETGLVKSFEAAFLVFVAKFGDQVLIRPANVWASSGAWR